MYSASSHSGRSSIHSRTGDRQCSTGGCAVRRGAEAGSKGGSPESREGILSPVRLVATSLRTWFASIPSTVMMLNHSLVLSLPADIWYSLPRDAAMQRARMSTARARPVCVFAMVHTSKSPGGHAACSVYLSPIRSEFSVSETDQKKLAMIALQLAATHQGKHLCASSGATPPPAP